MAVFTAFKLFLEIVGLVVPNMLVGGMIKAMIKSRDRWGVSEITGGLLLAISIAGATVARAAEETIIVEPEISSTVAEQSVNKLLKALESSNAMVSIAAARELGNMRSAATAALPGLVKSLKRRDSEIRSASADAVGNIGFSDMATIDAMRKLLSDEGADVRFSALIAFSVNPVAARYIVRETAKMIKDVDPNVRTAAARVLEAADTNESRRELTGYKQEEAIWSHQVDLRNKDEKVRYRAAEALITFGEKALPALIEALKAPLIDNDNYDFRVAAAFAIGRIGPRAAIAVPELAENLHGEDFKVRAEVVKALVSIGEPSIPALSNALNNEDGDVRSRAISALGKIGKTAVSSLIERLKSEDPTTRANIAYTLGKMGSAARPAMGALAIATKDDDPEVRRSAFGALASISPEMAVRESSQQEIPARHMEEQAGGESVNIAVTDLDAQGISASDAAVIADMLRNEMVRTGRFNVVEKTNMQKILAEQAFQQTGCTNQDCAVKIGKLLNVHRIIVGSFGKLMGQHILTVRVVAVETGKIIMGDMVKGGTVEEMELGVRKLAVRLAEQME